MRKLISITCFIACLCPLACLAQYTDHEAQAIARFERKLTTDITHDGLNGSISAVIMKNDKVIWARAFGYANRDTKKLADTGTIYRMGSITKTLTSTLLMMLVEDKMINLDDPAERYVPEVARIIGYSKDTKFTIRQLASHTSGLKRYAAHESATTGGENMWQGLLLQDLSSASFAAKPGKQWLYSDIGHAILQLALERAAGVRYVTMIKDRIIKPLHMAHTFFTISDPDMYNLAQGLDNTSGVVDAGLPRRMHLGRGPAAGNGSLYTTPTDLAKFISTFMVQPGLLTKASIHQMQLTPKGGKDYGLGLFTNPRTDVNFIGHSGFVPGYTSQFLIEQDSKYAVILMRNYNFGFTNLEETAAKLLEDI
jgi:CubicO group peptidase (beta-lactamase class C family)